MSIEERDQAIVRRFQEARPPLRQLAAEFGVSSTHVSRILDRNGFRQRGQRCHWSSYEEEILIRHWPFMDRLLAELPLRTDKGIEQKAREMRLNDRSSHRLRRSPGLSPVSTAVHT